LMMYANSSLVLFHSQNSRLGYFLLYIRVIML